MRFMYVIYLIWLFAPFWALGAWFVISLVQFLKTPKEDAQKRAQKRAMLAISSVIFANVALIYLLFLAVGIASST